MTMCNPPRPTHRNHCERLHFPATPRRPCPWGLMVRLCRSLRHLYLTKHTSAHCPRRRAGRGKGSVGVPTASRGRRGTENIRDTAPKTILQNGSAMPLCRTRTVVLVKLPSLELQMIAASFSPPGDCSDIVARKKRRFSASLQMTVGVRTLDAHAFAICKLPSFRGSRLLDFPSPVRTAFLGDPRRWAALVHTAQGDVDVEDEKNLGLRSNVSVKVRRAARRSRTATRRKKGPAKRCEGEFRRCQRGRELHCGPASREYGPSEW
ncbi:hypothetical protein C8Q70DRAFT_740395 [Cubamyces menziesii]|nr:hypothetical protein C8Q70DRAFT_740395 [Cubamyces menziesii]